ncbi:ribosome biogenesis GTPase YlqF [Gloeobacter kilaueensis]|uniref:Ribosome biogenesis GTPase A n=1 Tax=Gloeobacter kilaueensis (strain ATCC BAA-2537 / CCAP 1431/1 / ULC 316 / JS1) TaxID=1183438 RepID=U5QRT5_GLOK1|nr:ribosomal biogenesis GTPase [Gloeobacter kilaueensis JS1]
MESAESNLIQWYPGHIAKARRQLTEQIKNVDLVLEVLDARIPHSSRHAEIQNLVGARQRLVILNRADMIPQPILQRWLKWFASQGETAFATNAQDGEGVRAVLNAAQKGAGGVNARRAERGMKPRAVRAAVVGFPNVGKSALINRLVGKRAVESAAKPGVTRALRWVRIANVIDLLDSPGILPPRLEDQQAAARLAICDDIGQAAYTTSRVATCAVELLTPLAAEKLQARYGLDPLAMSAEAWLAGVAETRYHTNLDRAAEAVLNDFRRGVLGRIALEVPPAAPAADRTDALQ